MKKDSKPKKLDHVGIAVRSIEDTIIKYKGLLNTHITHEEVLPDQNLKVAFLLTGDQHLELLEPLNEKCIIYKFLEQRGEGLHHLAFKSKDIKKEFARAKKKGYQVLSEKPFIGANGKWVFFIHPKDGNGVLIEYCQKLRKKKIKKNISRN